MNIELPEKFEYTVANRYRSYVKEDKLYVPAIAGVWKKIAYNLTYALKGKKVCYYCGCKITRKTVTIDHMYPRNYGGISIPQNLNPTCPRCNNRKMDLNLQQFKNLESISDNIKKEEFVNEIRKEYEVIRYKYGFSLPEEWINVESIYEVQPTYYNYSYYYKKEKSYIRIEKFVKKYGNVPYPAIIDINNRILSGDHMYYVAKNMGINQIPTIKIENVEML